MIRSVRRLVALTWKETYRFLKVWQQTVLSPLMTGILYFTVFGAALSTQISDFDGIAYIAFIVPGLAIMQSTSQAMSNPSSSIMISKYQGTLIEMQLTPITPLERTLGYALGGMLRGLIVALALYGIAFVFVDDLLPVHPVLFAFVFIMSNLMLSSFGTLAGIWSKSFDQFSAITNFIILPLTFLGGVFYSVSVLPALGQTLTKINPFYYMVDLARYAEFGVYNTDPAISIAVITILTTALLGATYIAFKTGWRLEE